MYWNIIFPNVLNIIFLVDMKADDFQDIGFQLTSRNAGKEKASDLTG
jgi:hypothetical protein